jgi:hypothetical protein
MAITNQSRVNNRAGEILALSMNDAFDGLGRNIRRKKEEDRRRKEEDDRKKEDRERFETVAVELGMAPGAAAAASLPQLMGWTQSYAARETAETKKKTGEAIREFQMAMGHGAGEKASLTSILLEKEVFDPNILNAAQSIEETMRGGGSKWNLAPGAPVDLPGGRKGVATSPNSLQVLDQPETTAGGYKVIDFVPRGDGSRSDVAAVEVNGKVQFVNTRSQQPLTAQEQLALVQATEQREPGWLQRLFGGREKPAAPNAPPAAAGPTAPTDTGTDNFNDTFFSSHTL